MSWEFTEWFRGDQKPARAGIYQRMQGSYPLYWAWNGKAWEPGGFRFPSEVKKRPGKSISQHLPWRGLTSDPAKRAKATPP